MHALASYRIRISFNATVSVGIGEACDKPSKPFARVCADSRECQGEKTLDGLEWLYHPYLMLAVDSVDNLWPWDQMTVYWDAVTLDLGCGMCVPEPHHNSCWSPFVNATE